MNFFKNHSIKFVPQKKRNVFTSNKWIGDNIDDQITIEISSFYTTDKLKWNSYWKFFKNFYIRNYTAQKF